METQAAENKVETPQTLEFGSRYIDDITEALANTSAAWESIYTAWQQTNLRAQHATPLAAAIVAGTADYLDKKRGTLGRFMSKTLDQHVLSDWLPAGLRGPQVCRLIGMIGDPHRFPGRKCSEGHHVPGYHEGLCHARVAVGSGDKKVFVRCNAEVGEIRRGTGSRALWHYLGLHVRDGKLPKPKKGVQCTWNPKGRVAVLMPQGVADQIIMRNISPWREIYDAKKLQLGMERGADARDESGTCVGANGAEVVGESDQTDGSAAPLPPWRIHKIARTVAAKAFVADMLAEWKARTA